MRRKLPHAPILVGADLAEIVRGEMSPYAGRVHIEGPSLALTARAAQNFALAVHELATNAAKYGALSNVTGRVQISWSKLPSNGSSLFTFRWKEQGGPPCRRRRRKDSEVLCLNRSWLTTLMYGRASIFRSPAWTTNLVVLSML
jgi:two-component sensor histidine kinase